MPKLVRRLLFRKFLMVAVCAAACAFFVIAMFILNAIQGGQVNFEKLFRLTGVAIFIGIILGLVFVFRTWSDGVSEAVERIRKAESLTCECGKLAEPIDDTDNRYSCKHCNRQFAGPAHSL